VAQLGILEPVPLRSRYLTFRLAKSAAADSVRAKLGELEVDARCVIGIGPPTFGLLEAALEGMRPFPSLVGRGVEMPGTGGALWVWLRGEDLGDLLYQDRALRAHFAGVLEVEAVTDSFRYHSGFDLSGYEDGTENPVGDDAVRVALLAGVGEGRDGGSFVAVQRWVHDLDTFGDLDKDEQDQIIGRRKSDNEELQDAPASAHVKRTAQEDFTPEAFVVRRSMPWCNESEEGLVFVAFGASLDPFEAIARRMLGLDDGIVDALFRFTRPVTGAYFFCPPLLGGHLDLRALDSPQLGSAC
jgi:porphyrinogen peroxidase